jgi:tryptophan synthase alpha chain
VNRLEAIFGAARGRRTLTIPYVCAGDPSAEATCALLAEFDAMGIEIAEVGVPFSDPIGDGRTIAAASQRALDGGMTLARVLDVCASVPNAPAIVLFSYLSPIARYGLERFARDAERSGVSSVIIADVPFEEAAEVVPLFRQRGVGVTQLIAPNTPLPRAVEIAGASDGFAYVVSRMGVTGAAREPDTKAAIEQLRRLRSFTARPLAVGFGLAKPQHVRRLAPHADALVVGSALVDDLAGQPGDSPAAAARRFLEPLLDAALKEALRSDATTKGG